LRANEDRRVFSFCSRLIAGARRRPKLTAGLLILSALAGLGAYPGTRYVQANYLYPWRHYRAAQEALERRDFAAAHEELSACVQAWPDDAAMQFQAARAARRAGMLDEAEEHFLACERLLEMHPNANVGDTKLEWALLKAERGDLLKVEEQLRARLRDDHPDSVLILEVLSWQLMMSGRLREGRDYLDAWLRREPENYDALVRRGWVAEHLFDFPGALEYYRQALALDARQDFVRLRVVEILLERNRAPEALADLELLRRHQAGNPSVRLCWARYQRLQGNTSQARQLLDELLSERSRDPQALSERGVLAMEAGRLDEAEGFLRTAAALDASSPQINYNLCLCLERVGKKEEAKKFSAKLAEVKADRQRMDRLLREAMTRPHDPDVRYEVGMIFLRNGFTQDGLRWLASALRENPSHRPAHIALAEYYERAGSAEQAAVHRRYLEQQGK